MERNFQGPSNRHRVSLSRDGTTAPLHCLIALCVAAFTVLYATICGISHARHVLAISSAQAPAVALPGVHACNILQRRCPWPCQVL